MKNLKSVLFYVVVVIFFSSLLEAQTITQSEYLDILKEKHPLFDKGKIETAIEKADREILLGAEDVNVYSYANLSHENAAIAFAGPERTESLTLGGGVERIYWKNGARVRAEFSVSAVNIGLPAQYAGAFPETFAQNQISLSYELPLKRNKHGFLDQFAYNLKKYNIDVTKVNDEEVRENFLETASQKYLDWVFLSEQIKIIQERIKLSGEELENVKKRLQAYLVDEVDIIRAEDAVRYWNQNLMIVKSQWSALQGELAALAQDKDLESSSPDFDLFSLKEIYPVSAVEPYLRDSLRITKAINIRLEQLGYVKKGFEENMKPDLTAYGELNLRKVNDKILHSLYLSKPLVNVGLKYSFPKKNIKAKAEIEKNKLEAKYLRKQIDEIVVNVVSALTNLYIQIKDMENVMKLDKELIKSAKKRTEEELKLYNQGRGQLTFVIQSRDNEQNAQLAYTMNALKYNKLIVSYNALMDQLLK